MVDNVMFEVEVVIALITFVVYFLNGSWRLGLRFKAAAKKLIDEGGKSKVSLRWSKLWGLD